jgi:hypothetical protein
MGQLLPAVAGQSRTADKCVVDWCAYEITTHRFLFLIIFGKIVTGYFKT